MTLFFHSNRAGTREPARRRVHQRPPAAKPHPPQGTDHAHMTAAKYLVLRTHFFSSTYLFKHAHLMGTWNIVGALYVRATFSRSSRWRRRGCVRASSRGSCASATDASPRYSTDTKKQDPYGQVSQDELCQIMIGLPHLLLHIKV